MPQPSKPVAAYKPKKGEAYMSPAQLEHFRSILDSLKTELSHEIDRTVHTMQGSKLRTMCWTAIGVVSPGRTGAPSSASSPTSAPCPKHNKHN